VGFLPSGVPFDFGTDNDLGMNIRPGKVVCLTEWGQEIISGLRADTAGASRSFMNRRKT
jgi:hypothetical protein